VAEDPRVVLERLLAALNAHDLERMVGCFADDYRSEQPAHPARAFVGVEQVRKNWRALLEQIPDLRAELIASAVDGDTVWAEMRWTGTKTEGTPLDERGVTILGIRDDRIAWGRLYMEEVEANGAGIDETVDEMTGTSRDAV
jgi:ketosteroid isomerase-like protein